MLQVIPSASTPPSGPGRPPRLSLIREDGRPLRILIVEDEQLVALDLASLIEQYGGVALGTASSAEAAIRMASTLRPDVVLMDIHLERMLKQHRQLEAGFKRVLELNPRHPLVLGLAQRVSEKGGSDEVNEAAWLLLDQARIVGGEPLPDPTAFSKRLSEVMRRALAP